jgi:exodeoxyribonuclease V alpha subunit
MAMNLSTEQMDAIEMCCDTSIRISNVTGQAGTGKTTILKDVHTNLVQIFGEYASDADDKPAVVLGAPTGRAAKRIEEATGIPAMTIHRMLRYTTPADDEDKTMPRHDKFYPMPYSVILIDESSMLSEELYRGLIDAMRKGALIRFFGDINQLPPVVTSDNEAVSPFNIAMKKFPTAVLTHNYRSDDGIISVSDSIIKGRFPIANSQVNIFRIKSTETMYSIRDMCDGTDFMDIRNQIICPTQTTMYGCEKINIFIQQRYNKEREKINTYQKDYEGKVFVRSFKRGDKIIWTKNDYNLEIMNGTIGIVQSFDLEEGSLLVTFDGDRDVLIPPSIEGFNVTTGEKYRYDPRTYLMLAYAVTTHKSQGSQFDIVLYVLSNSRAATRQNLYTAVTRAKKKLVVLNIGGALFRALENKTKV